MKKIALLLILTLIFATGCSKSAEPEAPKTPTQATPKEELELKDRIFENVYAGRVTEITDTEITIKMDERVDETFELNDRAKADIKDFEIAVDSRIIVKFVSPEDRTITAIEVIKSE